MRKYLIVCVLTILVSAAFSNTILATQEEWQYAMNRSLDWLQDEITRPSVGSVGGEWVVTALARSGRVTLESPWVHEWLNNLEQILAEVDSIKAQGYDIQNPPSAGTFPSNMRRWTDFARVSIALSSLGLDATDFNGRNLTNVFNTYVPVGNRHALNRTINVETFALIALDTKPYSGDRQEFINQLINAQLPNGAWSMSSVNLDITIMAAQALATHYHTTPPAMEAVDKTLNWLRPQTLPCIESTAQMVILLTMLGDDFLGEATYYVNHLLTWFDPISGGFKRTNSGANHMATEQAAKALVAYWRAQNNKTSFYDKSDVFSDGSQPLPIINNRLSRTAINSLRNSLRQPASTIPSNETKTVAEFLTYVTNTLNLPDIQTDFNPHGIITRQEAAVIVTRAAELMGINTQISNNEIINILAIFGDYRTASRGSWEALAFCYREGILDDDEFYIRPHEAITHSEAVEMVYRLFIKTTLR